MNHGSFWYSFHFVHGFCDWRIGDQMNEHAAEWSGRPRGGANAGAGKWMDGRMNQGRGGRYTPILSGEVAERLKATVC